MEQYTHLNENEIGEILSQFDIHDFSSFELLSGGSENTNYLVKSRNEKFVLSVFEQKTKKNVKKIAHLLKHLESNRFNTSRLIYSSFNEPVIIWNSKPIILKVYIEGIIKKDLSLLY